MRTVRRIGGVLLGLLAPLALLTALGWLTLQIYTGDYGRIALERAERERAAMERKVERLERLETAMRARNAGLKPESLDLDLLDERARAELGMIRSDEVFLIEP